MSRTPPITFRIDRTRGEIVALRDGHNETPAILTNCTIFDVKNWACDLKKMADGRFDDGDPTSRYISRSRYKLEALRKWLADDGDE